MLNDCKINITIITPMYNTDIDSLTMLCRSISGQTCSNFEWIIIDDYSDYEKFIQMKKTISKYSYNYMLYRNQTNLGAGKTREKGISYANGNYIVFIDSDDYITYDFTEKISLILESKPDIVLFDYIQINSKKKILRYTVKGAAQGFIDAKECIKYITSNICGKVIRKDLIINNGIEFLTIPRFEDWAFIVICMGRADSVYYIKEHLYFYVNNKLSISHTVKLTYKYALYAFEEIARKAILPKKTLEILFNREVLYTAIKQCFREGDTLQSIKCLESLRNKYNYYELNLHGSNSLHQNVVLLLYKLKFYNALNFIFKYI